VNLAEHLERIERHIPCLEAAALDESAPALVRAVARTELTAWKLAAGLAALDRTNSDASGTTRNATEQLGTETSLGH
jgi:ABC-type transporter Mla subunit MlaD